MSSHYNYALLLSLFCVGSLLSMEFNSLTPEKKQEWVANQEAELAKLNKEIDNLNSENEHSYQEKYNLSLLQQKRNTIEKQYFDAIGTYPNSPASQQEPTPITELSLSSRLDNPIVLPSLTLNTSSIAQIEALLPHDQQHKLATLKNFTATAFTVTSIALFMSGAKYCVNNIFERIMRSWVKPFNTKLNFTVQETIPKYVFKNTHGRHKHCLVPSNTVVTKTSKYIVDCAHQLPASLINNALVGNHKLVKFIQIFLGVTACVGSIVVYQYISNKMKKETTNCQQPKKKSFCLLS